MNLEKPAILKTSKYIYIALAVIIIAGLTFGSIFYFLKPKQEIVKTNKSNVSQILSKLQTSKDFFSSFTKKEEPKSEPKPKAVKPEPKPVPPKIKKEIGFEEIFRVEKEKKEAKLSDKEEFLKKANKSTQIRVFKKFDNRSNFTIDNKKDEVKEIGYKADNTKASYPVDFSRTLTADRNINAILINEINSALAGKVVAQIEDNIYATQGRNILIPAGSRAIGYYQSLEKVGDTRLQILWSRIITPKGVNIVINSELADQMGRSGLGGEVDTRFWDRYGLTLLISTINAVAQFAAKTSSGQAVLYNTYGKDLSNISAKILEEQINIKPIITINAGTRILISPLQDIWFRDVDGNIEVKAIKLAGEI